MQRAQALFSLDLLRFVGRSDGRIVRWGEMNMFLHVAPGRPLADECLRSSVPTDWQMFRDVNATEDWDGKCVDRAARL